MWKCKLGGNLKTENDVIRWQKKKKKLFWCPFLDYVLNFRYNSSSESKYGTYNWERSFRPSLVPARTWQKIRRPCLMLDMVLTNDCNVLRANLISTKIYMAPVAALRSTPCACKVTVAVLTGVQRTGHVFVDTKNSIISSARGPLEDRRIGIDSQ